MRISRAYVSTGHDVAESAHDPPWHSPTGSQLVSSLHRRFPLFFCLLEFPLCVLICIHPFISLSIYIYISGVPFRLRHLDGFRCGDKHMQSRGRVLGGRLRAWRSGTRRYSGRSILRERERKRPPHTKSCYGRGAQNVPGRRAKIRYDSRALGLL